jgi:putative ABC transport system ATP-binding protein
MDTVLEGVGLTKHFGQGDARVTAVNDVSIAFGRGELVVITGDSGCGKTTLVSLLGCILTPSAGQVTLDGERVDFSDAKSLPQLRQRKVGFVFQLFNLIPYLTATQNVLLALDIAGIKGTEAERRAHELLTQVGLSHRLNHRPSQLSGGEKQRVSFARALANRPSILFADEPTANLDSRQAQNLLDLVRELRALQETTIVIVTHHLDLQKAADRVIRMRDGSVIYDGKPQNG